MLAEYAKTIGIVLVGFIVICIVVSAAAHMLDKSKKECVMYTHLLSEQVSEDGAYVIHKEGKTWICTL